jgi:hypothetical protein
MSIVPIRENLHLVLLCSYKIKLLTGLKSGYHIDYVITDADGFQWIFTGIYGEPKLEDRGATWRLLQNIQHHSNLLWLCTGDFNEILFFVREGRRGGSAPSVYGPI